MHASCDANKIQVNPRIYARDFTGDLRPSQTSVRMSNAWYYYFTVLHPYNLVHVALVGLIQYDIGVPSSEEIAMSGYVNSISILKNQIFERPLEQNIKQGSLAPLVEYLNQVQAEIVQLRTRAECICEYFRHTLCLFSKILPKKISAILEKNSKENNLKFDVNHSAIDAAEFDEKIAQYLEYCQTKNKAYVLRSVLGVMEFIHGRDIIIHKDGGISISIEGGSVEFENLKSFIHCAQSTRLWKQKLQATSYIRQIKDNMVTYKDGTVDIGRGFKKFQNLKSLDNFIKEMKSHDIDLQIAFDIRQSLNDALPTVTVSENGEIKASEESRSYLIQNLPHRFSQIDLFVRRMTLSSRCKDNEQKKNEIEKMSAAMLQEEENIYSKDCKVNPNDNFGAAQQLYFGTPKSWDSRYGVTEKKISGQEAFEKLDVTEQGVFHDLRSLLWGDIYYMKSLIVAEIDETSYMSQNKLVDSLRDNGLYKKKLVEQAVKNGLIADGNSPGVKLFFKPYAW